jgi:hypothetical protein
MRREKYNENNKIRRQHRIFIGMQMHITLTDETFHAHDLKIDTTTYMIAVAVSVCFVA